MQQSTELLVVTLAHILPGKEREARIHIRTVAEALQSAPGLISTRIYRGRNSDITYLLLTTWEDEESWLNAQERHTPKNCCSRRKICSRRCQSSGSCTISGDVRDQPHPHN